MSNQWGAAGNWSDMGGGFSQFSGSGSSPELLAQEEAYRKANYAPQPTWQQRTDAGQTYNYGQGQWSNGDAGGQGGFGGSGGFTGGGSPAPVAAPQAIPKPYMADQTYKAPAPGWGGVAQPGANSAQPGASSNPYLSGAGEAITNRMTQNMQRNVMPALSTGAMAAGQYGGSRQGVLEANAMRDMNMGLGDSLAAMYSQDWNAGQNRDLSRYQGDQSNATQRYGVDSNNATTRYGMDQSYNLGQTAQQNQFYTSQRGQDLQQAGLGAQIFQNGMGGEWDALNNAAGIYGRFSGLNQTQQNGDKPGFNWMGALGGGLSAYQMYLNSLK